MIHNDDPSPRKVTSLHNLLQDLLFQTKPIQLRAPLSSTGTEIDSIIVMDEKIDIV
jgi:hypothetical protein